MRIFDKHHDLLLPVPMIFRSLQELLGKHPPATKVAPLFSLPADTRVYAVGDIHGRADLLAKMMAAITRHAQMRPVTHIKQVFLGDYIDRGMQSRQVIDQLLASPADGHERICLLGNHEETMLRFLRDPRTLRDWANFGGYSTLASYGIPIPESMSPEKMIALRDQLQQAVPPTHLSFLKNLSLTYTIGDYLFVHAGILPNIPIAKQKREHLLWIREPFLNHEDFFAQYVVHGHTPVSAPDIHSHRANLDVSAAAVHSLCCLVIEGNERSILLVTDEKN